MAGPTGKRIVLVGGGHAHLHTIARLPELLARGASVTVVTAGRYHYYSGMGPALLAGTITPEALRFDIVDMAERGGATCVVDRAVAVDPGRRVLDLAGSPPVPYDIISFNIGSGIAAGQGAIPETVLPVKPIEHLDSFRRQVVSLIHRGTPRLLVVGGGAAGVELAGNLERLVRTTGNRAYVTLVTGGRLLPRFPNTARQLARESLENRKVLIVEGKRVVAWEGQGAVLDDGTSLPFDAALLAGGVTPPPLFMKSGLAVAEDGSLLVTETLQGVATPEILGGGDCVTLKHQPLERVGVYAVRQAPVIFANLKALLAGENLSRFIPQQRYLQLLNLGDGTALFIRGNLVYRGKSALFLKEYLDTSFVGNFRER